MCRSQARILLDKLNAFLHVDNRISDYRALSAAASTNRIDGTSKNRYDFAPQSGKTRPNDSNNSSHLRRYMTLVAVSTYLGIKVSVVSYRSTELNLVGE